MCPCVCVHQALTAESGGLEDKESKMADEQADIDPMLREAFGEEPSGKARNTRRVVRSFDELTTADRTRYLEVDAGSVSVSQGGVLSSYGAPAPPASTSTPTPAQGPLKITIRAAKRGREGEGAPA